jgi:hypothetical protein
MLTRDCLRWIGFDHLGRHNERRLVQADPHRRHIARIVARHIGCRSLATADQEIDDMVSQRIIIGIPAKMDKAAILGQRVFHDLASTAPGPLVIRKILLARSIASRAGNAPAQLMTV